MRCQFVYPRYSIPLLPYIRLMIFWNLVRYELFISFNSSCDSAQQRINTKRISNISLPITNSSLSRKVMSSSIIIGADMKSLYFIILANLKKKIYCFIELLLEISAYHAAPYYCRKPFSILLQITIHNSSSFILYPSQNRINSTWVVKWHKDLIHRRVWVASIVSQLPEFYK